MIAYFDTSSIVPLIVDEPATDLCWRYWTESRRVLAARLAYPEARAALARSRRDARITTRQLRAAVTHLDLLVAEFEQFDLTPRISRLAGELAELHQLRGADAVHLATAMNGIDSDFALVTGDRQLARAAVDVGLAVAMTAV